MQGIRKEIKIAIEANKKILNFQDVIPYLNAENHETYSKPGNTPNYFHINSIQPSAVIKAVSEGVNKRPAQISSGEDSLKKAIPLY